jgi:hypothetical protein
LILMRAITRVKSGMCCKCDSAASDRLGASCDRTGQRYSKDDIRSRDHYFVRSSLSSICVELAKPGRDQGRAIRARGSRYELRWIQRYAPELSRRCVVHAFESFRVALVHRVQPQIPGLPLWIGPPPLANADWRGTCLRIVQPAFAIAPLLTQVVPMRHRDPGQALVFAFPYCSYSRSRMLLVAGPLVSCHIDS